MSHVVTIETQVREPVALRAACRRLQLAEPREGTAKLFSGEATGCVVELPNWRYPVVFDLAARRVHFDNYGGKWGHQKNLDALLQAYAAENVALEARKQGYTTQEQTREDGSIKVTICMGGSQ